ncbi:MAG: hypothetical protein FRX48_08947 [Lasallia pustulata]|uniref:Uncharacterized protein n=1 Tax=Lasallia pustulata TaxID=136370 RepID=A0A5M8PDS2_9LECA|nr:MAG: hypothetical protein FRX48_08947 [Lasallia pustulata]
MLHALKHGSASLTMASTMTIFNVYLIAIGAWGPFFRIRGQMASTITALIIALLIAFLTALGAWGILVLINRIRGQRVPLSQAKTIWQSGTSSA